MIGGFGQQLKKKGGGLPGAIRSGAAETERARVGQHDQMGARLPRAPEAPMLAPQRTCLPQCEDPHSGISALTAG